MIGKQEIEPRSGLFLLSNSTLSDPNFFRSVVLLCEHTREGSFGLVMNQPIPFKLSEGVPGLTGWDAPLYRGGPVQTNSLHFVHGREDLDLGSLKVAPGVYWGGDFKKLNHLMAEGVTAPEEFRFFIGYSGWGQGQLHDELEQNSWYLTPANHDKAFTPDADHMWEHIMTSMGPDFAMLCHIPLNPRTN
jgi:putative transcriptional regulator